MQFFLTILEIQRATKNFYFDLRPLLILVKSGDELLGLIQSAFTTRILDVWVGENAQVKKLHISESEIMKLNKVWAS